MTVTALASISLLALAVTAAPLPNPNGNEASQIERLSLDVQSTAQSLLQSRLGQTPKCVGCEHELESHVHIASVEGPHGDILADLNEVGAEQAAVAVDLPYIEKDEKKVYDITSVAQATPEGLGFKAEALTPVPTPEGEDNGIDAKSSGLSPRQITLNLTRMAVGVTVGCIFGLLYLTYMARTRVDDAFDPEDPSSPEKSGDSDNFSSYGDEKQPLITVVTQPTWTQPVPSDEEKRGMQTECSPTESGYSTDEELDEKFVDAEEPPALVDTSTTEVPQIIVQQHPDPELLPLPIPRPSTPYSTPPPTPPRSPLRKPLQMREANMPSPLARPAWSQRAADAPSLGLGNATPSRRGSPSPFMRSISSTPVTRPGTPKLFIPGAFSDEDEDEKRALAEHSTRSRAYRAPVPELDIAFALQLRPGLGLGSDPAWLVRFLMAMFGWMTVFIGSGTQTRQNQRRAIA